MLCFSVYSTEGVIDAVVADVFAGVVAVAVVAGAAAD